jgi:dihydropteroate synthase
VLGERTLVMGVLNATPDSFSDGGRLPTVEAAVVYGLGLFEAGADWVDVGGESTRPGAVRVTSEDEIRRVVPVIEGLRRRGAGAISVDTTKAAVAASVLLGAHLVRAHDVAEMVEVVRVCDAIVEAGGPA